MYVVSIFRLLEGLSSDGRIDSFGSGKLVDGSVEHGNADGLWADRR